MKSQIGIKPHPAVGLVAVRQFCREVAIHNSTHWRWVKRGWIGTPINIAGRLYHTADQIEEFRRRALAGEFAQINQPPQEIRRV